MIVSTAAFHRMIYNARLLQIGKTANVSVLSLEDKQLTATSSDGHFYLRDSTDVAALDAGESFSVSLSPGTAKAIELALRDAKEDVLAIQPVDDYLEIVGLDVYPTGDTIDLGDSILDPNFHTNYRTGVPFALMPDRFRKLSLIKPGDWPLDFKLVRHNGIGRMLMLFKAGPTVRGALALLDREILEAADDIRAGLWN